MGALASLLPGLRELRAPLAAGYLWLLDLWLLFGTHIPSSDEATGVVKRLYELEGVVADLGTGLGLSFVAYLVGTLSEWGSRVLFRPLFRRASFVTGLKETQDARAELMSDESRYAEYDRYKAEAEFRLAIFPPLVLLVCLAALGVSWWWGFLLVPVVALAAQGYVLLRQALVILSDAKTRAERGESSSA